MSSGGQGTKYRRNIAENFNRLSSVHECYRQTTDSQTDGRQQIANENVSSRSLKITDNFVKFCYERRGIQTYKQATDTLIAILHILTEGPAK